MSRNRNPRAYFLEQLVEQLKFSRAGERWLEFIDNETMSAGLYALAAGAEDPQQPHEYDELYFITRGQALLRVGGRDEPARPGSILFVPARIVHRFVGIVEDLEAVVFFSKAPPPSV